MTTFDSTKASLNDLLREIREGKIQLPDFRRGWVWDDDHIRDLLVSTRAWVSLVRRCCPRPHAHRQGEPWNAAFRMASVLAHSEGSLYYGAVDRTQERLTTA